MRIKIYMFVACVVALTASCNKENSEWSEQSATRHDLTIEATLSDFDADNTSRATGESVIRLNWSKNDAVSVINLTTGKVLGGDLKAVASGTTATFTGTVIGTIDADDQLALLYPSQNYTEEQTYTPVEISLASQNGSSNVPICVYGTMNYSNNEIQAEGIKFTYLVGYVRLNMSDLAADSDIQKVVVENVAPTMELNITDSAIVATPTVGNLTITPTVSANSKGNQTIFFTTATSTEQASRKIKVQQEDMWAEAEWINADLLSGHVYNSVVAKFVDEE